MICLIGLIIGSCFGIFFSGEDSGTGQTMQTAVQEINTEYQENLDEIKAAHSYDVLEMSGSRAVWKEVLAVYAVKTTTDPDAAQEVATMDEDVYKRQQYFQGADELRHQCGRRLRPDPLRQRPGALCQSVPAQHKVVCLSLIHIWCAPAPWRGEDIVYACVKAQEA